MSENLYRRAQLLFRQNRLQEAVRIMGGLLSQNPDNVKCLALMAEIKAEQGAFETAAELINNAIQHSPDWSILYYIKSRIQLGLDQYDNAEACLEIATSIDPADADYYALWAAIKLDRKKFQEALDLSNRALELDPTNIQGLNCRSTAQLKLGDKAAAAVTIKGALKENPNNPYTHANYGWGLLEKGDAEGALKHFSEALKNDPNLDSAQAGMGQALKARYTVYRWFLKYAFWLGNLTEKYQWGVIIGFYLLMRMLGRLAENSTLKPFLNPLLALLVLLAFSTWVIVPLSNLFLRFNKYGNHLLSDKEKMSANFVGASALVFAVGAICYFLLGDERFLPVAVFSFAMMVPFSVMLMPTKPKHILVYLSVLLCLLGCAAIFITFTEGELYNMPGILFLLGMLAFQFFANYVSIRRSNR